MTAALIFMAGAVFGCWAGVLLVCMLVAGKLADKRGTTKGEQP